MPLLGPQVANGKPERDPPPKPRVREKRLPRSVHAFHDLEVLLILFLSGHPLQGMAERHRREGYRCHKLPPRFGCHPASEGPGEVHVEPYAFANPFGTEVPKDEPQF